MLNENAKKWVAALRSGEYTQGRGMLCRDDHYCCLGVACEVYKKDGGTLQEDWTERAVLMLQTEPVRLWLGLASENGRIGNDSLAHFNDSGKTFAEIAGLIESEPPGLFVEA